MLLFLTANMAAVTSRANQQDWLFSQAVAQSFLARLGLKMLPETGEQTTGWERGTRTGNRKNEKWDMVRFFLSFPSSRSSVIVPSSPSSLLQFWQHRGRRSRRKQERRKKEEGQENKQNCFI